MRDFLRGTLGTLLQILLGILGAILFVWGGMSCMFGSVSESRGLVGGGSFLVFLGVLCFCSIVGIRYWLGSIHRLR